MASEEGIVFRIDVPGTGTAWVKTTRSSACESCSSRHACLTVEESGKEMEVEAINTAGARVGDRVVLNIRTATLLKATFLLYVFPILAMIAGAVLGERVAVMRAAEPSGFSVLFGFLFFGLAFVAIRTIGRRLAGKADYKPEIIKIRGRSSPPTNAQTAPGIEL